MERTPNQKKNKRGLNKRGVAINSENNPERRSSKRNFKSSGYSKEQNA